MCGIFGVVGNPEASHLTYLGLYALQHRGQESAGIVSADGGRLHRVCGMGEVASVFWDKSIFSGLPGDSAIGQVRYSTCGESVFGNVQPLVLDGRFGEVAVAHNGNLPGASALRVKLKARGVSFVSTTDTEVVLHLINRGRSVGFVDALKEALWEVQGAYSLLLQTPEAVYVARDRYGFRPLCLGKLESGGYAVASETCAFDLVGSEYIGDVQCGEILEIRPGCEIQIHRLSATCSPAQCIFEHVYFARPDSVVFGCNTHDSRIAMGRRLALESPAKADVVVPVPDSGNLAAIGYAEALGIPFRKGITRNHYVGRTFIEPKQHIRDFGTRLKLNAVRAVLGGRRVVLVDDSIVRGTTSRKIIEMVRMAGATEVHFRVSSPPFAHRCHFGIDTPTDSELVASKMTVEEVRQKIGADSLAYLSLDGLHQAVGGSGWCSACFTGEYPMRVTN